MEERLSTQRTTGLNTTGLRTWALVFLVLAAAGKALVQNRLMEMTGTDQFETAFISIVKEAKL